MQDFEKRSDIPSHSMLDGGGWSTPRPRHSTPAYKRYPLYRKLGGSQGQSRRLRYILPTGIRSPNRLARSESLNRLRHPGPRLMNVDIKNEAIKPSLCRFYELFIIVIGRERNADFSVTNGSTISDRIVSKSFKIFYFRSMFP